MTELHAPPSPLEWIGAPRHFRWLKGIVGAIVVMNVFDALMTIGWITTGFASEANPLMADLVNDRPVLFVLAKTTLVGLSLMLLWRLRSRPTAVVGIFVGFMVYYLLMLYHLQALQLNLLSRFG